MNCETMLIFFNSASRPDYTDNLYRIVGLPAGANVEMVYSTDKSEFAHLSRMVSTNGQCLICYFDREATDSDCFVPIRWGKALDVEHEHGRSYFRVELRDYCHAADTTMFTQAVRAGAPEAPHTVSQSGVSESSRNYFAVAKVPRSLVQETSESWRVTVDRIYASHALEDETLPAFISMKVRLKDSRKTIPAKNGELVFSSGLLRAPKKYELMVGFGDRYRPPGSEDLYKRVIRIKLDGREIADRVVGSVTGRKCINLSFGATDFADGLIEVESFVMPITKQDVPLKVVSVELPYRTETRSILYMMLAAIYLWYFFANGITGASPGVWTLTNVMMALLDFFPIGALIWLFFRSRGKTQVF